MEPGHPGMNIDSMVIANLVMVVVTSLWTVYSIEEDVVEVPIKQLDVRIVITLVMLLQIATP